MADKTAAEYNDLLSEWGWRMDAGAEKWRAPDGVETHCLSFGDVTDAIALRMTGELVLVIEKWGVHP